MTLSIACTACGDDIKELVGAQEVPEDAMLAIAGQWVVTPTMGRVFVPDPSAPIQTYVMPNGQLVLLPPEEDGPHRVLHTSCLAGYLLSNCVFVASDDAGELAWDDEDLLSVVSR